LGGNVPYRRWQRGIWGFLWSGSWILQSEFYAIFGQALQYIYVEQKNFASPFIGSARLMHGSHSNIAKNTLNYIKKSV
jgi:hypothetical protein